MVAAAGIPGGARVRPAREDVVARAEAAVAALRARPGETPLEMARAAVDARLRTEAPELLDLPTTPAAVRARILGDLDRLNRMLRLYPRLVKRLAPMIEAARLARRGQPVRILDVGAGAGGLLFRLAAWARKRRIPVELTGVDADAGVVAAATRHAWEAGERIEFRAMDARKLDLADGEVDVVVTQLVLHHLPAGDAALVLAELDRVAAVNWLAFDLKRSAAALPALWAFLKLTSEATTRHDGVTSLRKAYSLEEVRALVEAAELADIEVSELRPAGWIAQRRSRLSV